MKNYGIEVSIEKVIRVASSQGVGVEQDPCRRVIAWFDIEGNHLWTDDPEPDAVRPNVRNIMHDLDVARAALEFSRPIIAKVMNGEVAQTEETEEEPPRECVLN